MNEQEWLNCDDPSSMLEFLRTRGNLSDRKARLFAVACCRRIWTVVKEGPGRNAIEAAESYADGGCSSRRLVQAAEEASQAVGLVSLESQTAEYAATAATLTASGNQFDLAAEAAAVAAGMAESPENWLPLKWDEQVRQCNLLRDIVDSPFLPLRPLGPAILASKDGLVVKLAQASYDNRIMPSGHLNPDHLAVLADALEEVGADASLVEHVRDHGPHVRGCLVIDLLTNREAMP